MNRLSVVAFSALLAGTVTAPVAAQLPTAPRELGMGGAYMGVARGFESVFLAPGNLALPDAPRWSVAVPQVAIGGALFGPEISDLQDLLEYDELPQPRQDDLLALIPESGTRAEYYIQAPLVALSSGGFGLGLAFVSVGSHTLSRDLAELLLEGYEDGRTDYSVGSTTGDRAAYWDLAASYGRRIGSVSVGVTGHYLRGRTLARTRLFEPRVDLEAQEIEVDYLGVLARGGSGYGVDFGAAFQPNAQFTISAAVTNAFAKMTWSEDLKIRSLYLDRELIDNGRPRQLLNLYEGSEVDLDPQTASLQAFETAEGLYENAFAPAVARFGLAWSPFSKTRVAADYHKVLTEGRFGDQWDQRTSVGVEQGLSIFSLRAGYGSGTDGGNMVTGGLSIGPLDMGVARYQRSEIDGDATRGWIGTFGLSVDQPF